jgi:hypothetical protein
VNARDRYEVERQEPVGRQPGLWAIRDKVSGGLVLDSEGKQPETFVMRHSAERFIAMLISCGASRGR